MPVVDGAAPAGIVSSRDLLHAYRAGREQGSHNANGLLDRGAAVVEVMSTDLATIGWHESISG